MSNLQINQKHYPTNWPPKLLHHFLLQYAQKKPDACAIRDHKINWSYQELSTKAYEFAAIIQRSGLTIGDIAILQLETSAPAVALIIACSILGVTFVPLSPETPILQVEYILKTTDAKLYIYDRTTSLLPSSKATKGFLDSEHLSISESQSTSLPKLPKAILETNLAYIVFTSGTTGHPKGVMMTHRAALNFFAALINYKPLSEKDNVGTLVPFQFDVALLNIGHAFGCGATLLPIPTILRYHPKKLLNYFYKNKITQISDVPSLWKMILNSAEREIFDKLCHLKSIFVGGEIFPVSEIQRLQTLLPHLEITNVFGHSESIACSFTLVPNPLPSDVKNLSIGFAHPGAELYLIDEVGNEIENPYQDGQIYLRSTALFNGYWRNRQATDKSLVNNPCYPHSGDKVFCTGDFGYKDQSGALYFKGRQDLQVQIGGFRVELESVDISLNEHPDIVQAATIALEKEQTLYLAAYLVIQGNKIITKKEIRLFYSKTLPAYMQPKEIYFIEELPITTNGKVDREKLQKIYKRNNP